ncbi:MAG: LacI family DNA-binding transcriptional regulator [Opitutaceae bacterium]
MSVRRIARLARVSSSTVSLALRNSPKIRPATKRRVLAAAKRLGYRPNAQLAEVMSRLRLSREGAQESCLGVISFYDRVRPWEGSAHLARMYASMSRRAESLGYRLEPMWLTAPGMTYRRFRSILDARGIEGLLCFGSPDFDQEFPRELDHYAVVTQGLSIKTPLHRVVSHVYGDMWRALERIHALGYRRPGLIIGRYEEQRSAHAYRCAYLGWSQLRLGTTAAVPVLELERVEGDALLRWLDGHRPDVTVFVHQYDQLADFQSTLRRRGVRVPRDLGILAISQILEGSDFSGLQENQDLIGAWAVELLISRILTRDFGIPEHPRIEMVERTWVEGKTLRRK